MAIYGLSQWKKKEKSENSIDIWSFKKHSIIVSLIIVLSFITGMFLSETNAENPFLDSFTTWGSVIATYMVTKKVLTNWIFWIVINSVGIFLNFDKGLILTALLLFIYQIISVIGFVSWRRSYYNQIG
jgi:nicotinamide mononucleotide transporter